jgi:hypothetical protein
MLENFKQCCAVWQGWEWVDAAEASGEGRLPTSAYVAEAPGMVLALKVLPFLTNLSGSLQTYRLMLYTRTATRDKCPVQIPMPENMGGEGEESRVSVGISMLKAHDNMGTAEVACADGCTCEPQSFDLHTTDEVGDPAYVLWCMHHHGAFALMRGGLVCCRGLCWPCTAFL